MAQQAIPTDLKNKFFATSWIWTPEAEGINITAIFPAGSRAFRRWHTSPDRQVSSALILMTCDNYLSLYVNGHQVYPASGNLTHWSQIKVFDVALAPGQNLFAIECTNNDDIAPNPAGILAAIQINFTDGVSPAFIVSDVTWNTVSSASPQGFESFSLDDTAWVSARPLAAYGSAPWNNLVELPSAIPVELDTSALPPATSHLANPSPSTSNQYVHALPQIFLFI